jgi:protoheme IX farnesyltransferase
VRSGAATLARGTLAADLAELTKPKITLLVAVTTAAGFLLGAQGGAVAPLLLLNALAGTALVASGAAALNQVLERDTDARMRRTAGRPLPAGRLHPDLALAWGVGLVLAGLAYLAVGVNLLTALVGAVSAALYVFAYTPLKRVSSLATLVGAVPGALPPVMGWTAVRDNLEPGAWALFGILFLWQLPHFLSIAWLYRDDYAQGGFPMLSVADPDGRRTARQAVLYGAALVPVSLLPSVLGLTGTAYFVGALALSLAFLGCSVAFAAARTQVRARRLLLASVLYLPAILLVMLIDRLAAE